MNIYCKCRIRINIRLSYLFCLVSSHSSHKITQRPMLPHVSANYYWAKINVCRFFLLDISQ